MIQMMTITLYKKCMNNFLKLLTLLKDKIESKKENKGLKSELESLAYDNDELLIK